MTPNTHVYEVQWETWAQWAVAIFVPTGVERGTEARPPLWGGAPKSAPLDAKGPRR
jgi:hypothetical protein